MVENKTLHVIYQKGWMHRDITTQKILYLKGNSPEDSYSHLQEITLTKGE